MTVSPASWSRRADRQGAALGAAAAAAAFVLAWVLLHESFWARDQIRDTPVYQKYGDWMVQGRVPYRDFTPEYPPLALPVFALASLLAGDGAPIDAYDRRFEWLMAFCGAFALALAWVTLRGLRAGPVRRASALAFVALAPLALGSVVLSRFDLWPVALTAAAVAAFVHGRDRLGAGALGAAVAAKIYPAVLVPLAAVWIWRRRDRREAWVCGGVFVAVLATCFLPFLLVAPDGVASSLGRQLSRPLQIESLGSALLLALGADVEMESGHGSQNIAGSPGLVVGVAATLVQAVVLVGLWIAFARGPVDGERLVRYAAAAVLAFVALGKVLSPQFLVWLVPLVPLVRGARGIAASALLGLALVLTQLWFPYRYWDFARTFDETVAWLVLARDLVLVSVLVVLVTHDEGGDAVDRVGDERGEAARARVHRGEQGEGVVLR